MFVYKQTKTIEYVEKWLTFLKNTNFTGTLCFPNRPGQFNKQKGRKIHLNIISGGWNKRGRTFCLF